MLLRVAVDLRQADTGGWRAELSADLPSARKLDRIGKRRDVARTRGSAMGVFDRSDQPETVGVPSSDSLQRFAGSVEYQTAGAIRSRSDRTTLPAFEAASVDIETRLSHSIARLPTQQVERNMHLDPTISVRYLVDDVAAALDFYTAHFEFTIGVNATPAFAEVFRGNLRLLISGPASSAGRPMADGERPGPGGWNRIHFITDDLSADVDRLRSAGVQFRNDVVSGPAGAQILALDPAGNLIEIFQPAAQAPAGT